MTKTIINIAFILASIVIITVFVTSKTYPQLAFAVALYPILIYLAFMIFPRKHPLKSKTITQQTTYHAENETPKETTAIVAEVDRRVFLKLIGATGLSFFLFSLLGRRADTLLFGNRNQGDTSSSFLSNPFETSTATTEGYKISEIDEGPSSYYGFVNKKGAWLIMLEEAGGGTFRYTKGPSDFPQNWAKRENLVYDYYYNLF